MATNKNQNYRPMGGESGSTDMIAKYKDLLWGKKYWILLTTFIFTILWILIYSLFLSQKMEYTSTVTIKFDDPQRRSATTVSDIAEFSSEGKVTILYTNSFLFQVVDSLKLNIILHTPDINRFDLFRSIEIDEDAKFGEYKFLLKEETLEVYYTYKIEDIEDKLVFTGALGDEGEIMLSLNGVHLSVDTEILKKFPEIDIQHSPRLIVANGLRQNLISGLDRSRTILTLSFKYNHPVASAYIANTIADIFIHNLLEHKRFRTSSILISLADQLKAADKSLRQSEEALRQFRERNPYLLLSDAGSNIVEGLSGAEAELSLINHQIERLNSLSQQKVGSDKDLIYLELISLWEKENASTNNIFTEQYSDLLNNRTQLISQNYDSEHPRVLEVEQKLKNMQREIDSRIQNFQANLQTRQRSLLSQVNVGQRDLRRLPRGELQLAELKQDRDVKSQIYSTVLVRYNEAKISDASIIGDAFIIDSAEIPIVYKDVYDAIKILLIGPILGLILGIGLFVLRDFLDDTIKSREEVELILGMPVLASIPVVFDEKEFPDEINVKGQMDYKLITSDYAPTIAGEKFRLLRTKLLVEDERPQKTFLLTSLVPGDGKSLLAANLAITFAQQKVQTLLIDADLRRGVIHNTFNCNKKPGLSDILASNKEIDNDEIRKVIQKSHIPYLSLITCGIQIPNPSELLGGTQMKNLMEHLEQEFDIIIFDTPPIEYIPDALVLNLFIKNMILVVRYGRTRFKKISAKLNELSNIRGDFRGVIINASQEKTEKDQYSYSYYHY